MTISCSTFLPNWVHLRIFVVNWTSWTVHQLLWFRVLTAVQKIKTLEQVSRKLESFSSVAKTTIFLCVPRSLKKLRSNFKKYRTNTVNFRPLETRHKKKPHFPAEELYIGKLSQSLLHDVHQKRALTCKPRLTRHQFSEKGAGNPHLEIEHRTSEPLPLDRIKFLHFIHLKILSFLTMMSSSATFLCRQCNQRGNAN